MSTPNTKFIYGFHAIHARLRQNPDSILEILFNPNRHQQRLLDLLSTAESQGIKCVASELAKLTAMLAHANHQGIVARIDAAKSYLSLDDVLDTLTEPAFLLVLDGIQDPHNLGACLRVADAMGVHAVIAPKDKAASINATVSKVACGAAEVLPYITVTNLARTLRELKERNIWLMGAAGEGDKSLFELNYAGPLAWVMGGEGSGLRRLTREICDQLVNIPMFGTVESLNVSVATGICLAESRRQRLAKY